MKISAVTMSPAKSSPKNRCNLARERGRLVSSHRRGCSSATPAHSSKVNAPAPIAQFSPWWSAIHPAATGPTACPMASTKVNRLIALAHKCGAKVLRASAINAPGVMKNEPPTNTADSSSTPKWLLNKGNAVPIAVHSVEAAKVCIDHQRDIALRHT